MLPITNIQKQFDIKKNTTIYVSHIYLKFKFKTIYESQSWINEAIPLSKLASKQSMDKIMHALRERNILRNKSEHSRSRN